MSKIEKKPAEMTDKSIETTIHLPEVESTSNAEAASDTKPTVEQPVSVEPVSQSKGGAVTNWKMQLWTDQITGEFTVEIAFPTITGGKGKIEVTLGAFENKKEFLRKLRDHGASIAFGSAAGDALIATLHANLPRSAHDKVALPGWHGKAYIMPGRSLGIIESPVRVSKVVEDRCKLYGMRGTFAIWRSTVPKIAAHSTYLSLALLIGLAAPVRRFVQMREGALFNFSGPSSLGKTTLSMVALSIYCRPDRYADWNSTAIALEETAAAHNDMLLVLDDTEKAQASKLVELLDKAAHVIVEGQPKSYSTFYGGAQNAKSLRWRCTGISSSPGQLEQIGKKGRTQGQRLRHIDIPLQSKNKFGVFDRLRADKAQPGKTADKVYLLVKELERTIGSNHGRAIKKWIDCLVALPNAKRPQQLLDEFVSFASPVKNAPENRMAAKFGLAFAAGVLALEARILPWTREFVKEVCLAGYTLALNEFNRYREDAPDGMERLRAAINDRTLFPQLAINKKLSRVAFELMGGLALIVGGVKYIAVRDQYLVSLMGSRTRADALIKSLNASGKLVSGHGGKATVQLALKIVNTDGKVVAVKPRFYQFKKSALSTVEDIRKADG